MEKLKKVTKRILKNFLSKVPFVGPRLRHYDYLYDRLNAMTHNCGFEPGHYYSPIPNIVEIEETAERIFATKELSEIDLNTPNQLKLLEELKIYYRSYPYILDNQESKHLRYRKEGAWYRFSDAVFLFCMVRHFKPKTIIEIGSGHSSAIMLDVNELYFDNKIHHTFIEPHPEERLLQIFKRSDAASNNIIARKVQSVDLATFQTLEENDILFIDSSHIAKVGSDVNYLIFEVIPSLKPGVLIHFHDIFYPFELPKHWVLKYRYFWNENYLLRAFLMNNEKYEIVAFNTYLQRIRPEWFRTEMSECLVGSEDTGSIWLRKLA